MQSSDTSLAVSRQFASEVDKESDLQWNCQLADVIERPLVTCCVQCRRLSKLGVPLFLFQARTRRSAFHAKTQALPCSRAFVFFSCLRSSCLFTTLNIALSQFAR